MKASDIKLTFTPLAERHFHLLLKWLETPHVKLWWDQEIAWTKELIEKKYSDYVNGYKINNGQMKPMWAYVIYSNMVPIGYIQIYNPHDFAQSKLLEYLPLKLATFDVLIGEKDYLGHGIGSRAIKKFIENYCDISLYTHIFVNPERKNIAAIRAYEKAGLVKILELQHEVWMMREVPDAIGY